MDSELLISERWLAPMEGKRAPWFGGRGNYLWRPFYEVCFQLRLRPMIYGRALVQMSEDLNAVPR